MRDWTAHAGATARLVVAGLLVAAAVLVPLLLFGSLVRETIDRDVVARSAAERQVSAQIAAASIDRELRSAADAVVFFASSQAIQGALRDRDGRVLDRRLSELLRGRPHALGAVLDPAGIVLSAPLARELVGQDFSGRDYYRGAIASADPYISEIFASASAGNPSVIGIGYAVRGADATLGVVVLTLAPADLLELLEPLRQVGGRDLLVLDQHDRVVAATDPALHPLATVHVPVAGASLTAPTELAGQERIVTMGPVGLARWTLYVVDDPAVVFAAERTLRGELRDGSAIVVVIGLVAAGAVAFLYGRTARQRDELARGRAALAETNRALDEASRHKSDFLASMSHELRTPLNAILGFSELLQEQVALTERQARYLGNIRDAGEHLLALINDVLDLAKVEAGRVELRPEVVSVAALFEPVIASTHSAAQARGVGFAVRTLPADRAVVVDAGRLRQVLYNLLSNAVKFTVPGGSVTLGVAFDGSALVIEVADTGIGIPAEKRDRVFGTFERLHEERSDAPGTGLGLALSKQLVELQGGTIGFESEPGRGTTFRVRIPGVLTTVASEARVLVVDDEPRDAELIVALVAKAGLQSEVVRSVAAADAAIRRARPTAVVLDLRLPDGRGDAVLERLRADPATRTVPVIVVTVDDDDGRSRTLGADDHLTKPIDRARLDGWLRRIAARGNTEAAPAPTAG